MQYKKNPYTLLNNIIKIGLFFLIKLLKLLILKYFDKL